MKFAVLMALEGNILWAINVIIPELSDLKFERPDILAWMKMVAIVYGYP